MNLHLHRASRAPTIKTKTLFALSLYQPIKALKKIWWRIVEDHYLISAAVESSKAHQALKDAAAFQKKATLARSNGRAV